MKILTYLLLSSAIAMVTACNDEAISPLTSNASQPERVKRTAQRSDLFYNLAMYHAPVHYQDVDRTGRYSLGGKSDFITAINFDGDWNSKNNWANLESSNQTEAYVYYTLVETASHYFITYAFFHPRDWTDVFFLYPFDNHDNDLEGAVVMVAKDGTDFGRAQAMVTVFHSDFYAYVYPGSGIVSGAESVDGTLTLRDHNGILRPETSQEAKGHGLKAYAKQKPGGSDYVVYFPAQQAEKPQDIYDRNVSYTLVDLYPALWERRFEPNVLRNGDSFYSTVWTRGSANAPWAWNNKNDGDCVGCQRGELATNPARLFQHYFDGIPQPYSFDYSYNPYQGIGQ